MSDDTGHVRRNRAMWDEWAARYVADGEQAWASNAPDWGIWGVPERDVGMLPADLDGCDAIELGCGTGYVSSWLARRGARVTGIDNSARQLATARRLQREHALAFPLLHGDVASVMLSVTTPAHLREAAASVGDVAPDPARFATIVTALGA